MDSETRNSGREKRRNNKRFPYKRGGKYRVNKIKRRLE